MDNIHKASVRWVQSVGSGRILKLEPRWVQACDSMDAFAIGPCGCAQSSALLCKMHAGVASHVRSEAETNDMRPASDAWVTKLDLHLMDQSCHLLTYQLRVGF